MNAPSAAVAGLPFCPIAWILASWSDIHSQTTGTTSSTRARGTGPQTIDIDHFSRDYRVRPVFVGGSPAWHSGDADCSGMAARFLLTDLRMLGETIIAGVRSVGFLGRSWQRARKETWLAPSMGCSQMKVLESTFNSLGLPTSNSRIQVVNVDIAEPDPALFQVPAGYSRIR